MITIVSLLELEILYRFTTLNEILTVLPLEAFEGGGKGLLPPWGPHFKLSFRKTF